jgi:hypothetical protein
MEVESLAKMSRRNYICRRFRKQIIAWRRDYASHRHSFWPDCHSRGFGGSEGCRAASALRRRSAFTAQWSRTELDHPAELRAQTAREYVACELEKSSAECDDEHFGFSYPESSKVAINSDIFEATNPRELAKITLIRSKIDESSPS